MAGWYPIMLRLDGRLCVVIGGGQVAERKTAGLLEAGAKVRVVSPELTPALSRLVSEAAMEWRKKEAEPSDWDGAFLAFAATDRPEVNRAMAEAAKESGIPVNVADEGESGDFILPAVLRRGDLLLAAGVSGSGPALAARIVRELAERYGPEYAGYAAAYREVRAAVRSYAENPEERRRLLAAAAEEEVLAEWASSGLPGDPRGLVDRLRARVRPNHEV
ncbi:precorrin-2 dehydrogenase/sirohydrochlorin ferrochelatase family protein [Cohnella caldifontis]|uniref:precorrin-2 dehydrogenase/sirohydrochlorin ferrochelatase family protein n=1 Tax=Cohnella caldifontis TaxID=3027471 RepID=UPI0023EDFA94|nr:bifunctional precorrin-2 dehydrogenase/sirohydrochlorin ferrochelatase [Cohnella sp. YIM B05605]